jgi:hypothetical protein
VWGQLIKGQQQLADFISCHKTTTVVALPLRQTFTTWTALYLLHMQPVLPRHCLCHCFLQDVAFGLSHSTIAV